MTLVAIFGWPDQLWDTALVLFVVVPVTLLWGFCLVDTVRRSMPIYQKALWITALVLFPIVAAPVYLILRPRTMTVQPVLGLPLAQIAATVRDLGTVTDNLATTIFSAQETLAQSTSIVREVTVLLDTAGNVTNVTVPFTRLRPLENLHDDVTRLGVRLRYVGASLERTAAGLGTNAADLRRVSGSVQALALALNRGGDTPDAPDATQPVIGAVAWAPAPTAVVVVRPSPLADV